MNPTKISALALAVSFLAACASNSEGDTESTVSEVGSGPADLRADTNRDGVVDLDDPADDVGEDAWTAEHGAIFLANIDDDSLRCKVEGVADVDLPRCNDAEDEVVNGPDDALDLARLKTRPWAEAPEGTTGSLTWDAIDTVRLFKVEGDRFTPIPSGATFSLEELRRGLDLAIEGRDIVRDRRLWDGLVSLTYSIVQGGTTYSDKVVMRVSPVMTFHHGLAAERTWVANESSEGNSEFRADLVKQMSSAGLAKPVEIETADAWVQDFFETGYMSMPGPKGAQRSMRVNFRSANERQSDARNPLRPAGRIVFSMRGKDVAAIQQFDPKRGGAFDTLNSFGNLETVPPYTQNGKSYPLGRILRGHTPEFFADKTFVKMMESQQVQPPIYVDTSWLSVGHVDETISFIKAKNARGWVLLLADPTLARDILTREADVGRGGAPMFVGKTKGDGSSAWTTIDEVLGDTEIMAASAEAAVEIDAQLAKLKAETGLTDAEIVHVPFLHERIDGKSVAFQPAMVNGFYSGSDFFAPKPQGPVIDDKDLFEVAMEEALAPFGVRVHFVENWDAYHRFHGEVHCGTNTARSIPTYKWWESGR